MHKGMKVIHYINTNQNRAYIMDIYKQTETIFMYPFFILDKSTVLCSGVNLDTIKIIVSMLNAQVKYINVDSTRKQSYAYLDNMPSVLLEKILQNLSQKELCEAQLSKKIISTGIPLRLAKKNLVAILAKDEDKKLWLPLSAHLRDIFWDSFMAQVDDEYFFNTFFNDELLDNWDIIIQPEYHESIIDNIATSDELERYSVALAIAEEVGGYSSIAALFTTGSKNTVFLLEDYSSEDPEEEFFDFKARLIAYFQTLSRNDIIDMYEIYAIQERHPELGLDMYEYIYENPPDNYYEIMKNIINTLHMGDICKISEKIYYL